MSDTKTEAVTSVAQAAPSLTAVTIWFTSKDVNFYLAMAGIAFIGLQAAYLLWQWSWKREIRRKGLPPPSGD